MKKKKPVKAPPIGDEKEWEEWGKQWEDWGEEFGRKMEAKFCGHPRKKELSVFGLVFSLLVLAWGVVWLGNDLGWWEFSFPFWPVLVVLIGLGALDSTIKNAV